MPALIIMVVSLFLEAGSLQTMVRIFQCLFYGKYNNINITYNNLKDKQI